MHMRRAGEVVRLSKVAVSEHARDGALLDIIAEHRGDAAFAGGGGDGAVAADHQANEIDVQGHAQKRERDTGAANVLLGGEVVASEREDRVGRGHDPRQQGGYIKPPLRDLSGG